MIRSLHLCSSSARRDRFYCGTILRCLLLSASLVGLPVAAITEGTPSTTEEAQEDADPATAQQNREMVRQGFEKKQVAVLRILLGKPTTSALVIKGFISTEDEGLRVAMTIEVLRDSLWKSSRVHPRTGNRVNVAGIAQMIDPVIRAWIPDYGTPEELQIDETLRLRLSQKLLEHWVKVQHSSQAHSP